MLTKTTEYAIQTLIYLSLRRAEEPLSPRLIAETLDLSPTYLAKVTNLLVRSNILRSYRGAQGGVTLRQNPKDITLLQIVEACQGQIVGDYCTKEEREAKDLVCGFHRAMKEVHKATIAILTKWTLQDLADQPCPFGLPADRFGCPMGRLVALKG